MFAEFVVVIVMKKIGTAWIRFWMLFAGTGPCGRVATWLATIAAPPYKGSRYLARYNKKGFFSPSASIYHTDFRVAGNVFVGDHVVVYQHEGGGPVELGKRVHIHRDTIIETGQDGSLRIGENSHIQPRCQFSAFLSSIDVGRQVQIGPNCAFYSYNHSINGDRPMRLQPLQTKGGIVIEDDVWIGFGVIVLDGVKIGKGAVLGAGSVVTRDIPENTVAVGVPAKTIGLTNK